MSKKPSIFKHRLDSDKRRYSEQHGGDATLNIIQDAARQKDRDYLRYLARHLGINYTVDDKTALFWLAGTGDTEAVQMLIDCAAITQPSGIGAASPLMHAAYHNQLDMAKLLVKHGARANYIDKNGGSALSIAKERGYPEMVAFLEKCMEK